MKQKLLIFAGFILAAAFIVFMVAKGFDRALERRTLYKYIASALNVQVEPEVLVSWKEAQVDLVRPVTAADKVEIGRALAEAWRHLAVGQDSGDENVLRNRFTAEALKRAIQSVEDATEHGGRMIVLNQKVEPIFFHLDGSLFQAKVEMDVARYLPKDELALSHFSVARESGVVSLTKGAVGWTIYAYERKEAERFKRHIAPWQGKLVGVNYFPAETPWRSFWPEFDPNKVMVDFDHVKDLNANAVRIFIGYEDFVGPDRERSLANLELLLRLAEERQLQVIPTLFDLKQDFGLGTWGGDVAYLANVLPVLEAAENVAFVDLKNEPDLDFASNTPVKILSWLRTMAAASRDFAPSLPLTVGWSKAERANLLLSELDVVTYHEYEPSSETEENLRYIQSIAGPKPVLITEIGETSYGVALGFPSSANKQRKRLKSRLDALSKADGVLIWSLFDFVTTDAAAIGSSPWNKRLQANFGVLQSNGAAKPATAMVSEWFEDFQN